MKIEVLGLSNSPKDRKVMERFQQLAARLGPAGLVKKFGAPIAKDGVPTLVIDGSCLRLSLATEERSALDEFLRKYASPDDLAAYERVKRLEELYGRIGGTVV